MLVIFCGYDKILCPRQVIQLWVSFSLLFQWLRTHDNRHNIVVSIQNMEWRHHIINFNQKAESKLKIGEALRFQSLPQIILPPSSKTLLQTGNKLFECPNLYGIFCTEATTFNNNSNNKKMKVCMFCIWGHLPERGNYTNQRHLKLNTVTQEPHIETYPKPMNMD